MKTWIKTLLWTECAIGFAALCYMEAMLNGGQSFVRYMLTVSGVL